jgi:hypothetical protein
MFHCYLLWTERDPRGSADPKLPCQQVPAVLGIEVLCHRASQELTVALSALNAIPENSVLQRSLFKNIIPEHFLSFYYNNYNNIV